jgi:hypothetical protein
LERFQLIQTNSYPKLKGRLAKYFQSTFEVPNAQNHIWGEVKKHASVQTDFWKKGVPQFMFKEIYGQKNLKNFM